jgi:hypothetical protein
MSSAKETGRGLGETTTWKFDENPDGTVNVAAMCDQSSACAKFREDGAGSGQFTLVSSHGYSIEEVYQLQTKIASSFQKIKRLEQNMRSE